MTIAQPFQGWVLIPKLVSPEGTADTRRINTASRVEQSAVPSGLVQTPNSFPNLKRLGYYRISLREKVVAAIALFCSGPAGTTRRAVV